ncbi:hypothetical protein PPACK8108_LOCUS23748 [Phakopsora pachyrhizi]|uniref:Uncharacterized protein n=1 Tax=Phakopsora pachyrhizi TaxID=170000 RepID=A0AAV0BT46_PHAPC|nr:hypothetical protein PPACK8108_LOCUS23748 [Phakopsora pachyrhizi]
MGKRDRNTARICRNSCTLENNITEEENRIEVIIKTPRNKKYIIGVDRVDETNSNQKDKMITRGKEREITKRREAKEGRTKELKDQLEVMVDLESLEEKNLEEPMGQDYGASEKGDESGEEYSAQRESQSSSKKDSTLTLIPKTELTQGFGIKEPLSLKYSSPEIYVLSIPSSMIIEDKLPIPERDNLKQIDWRHWRKKNKIGVDQVLGTDKSLGLSIRPEQPKAESSAVRSTGVQTIFEQPKIKCFYCFKLNHTVSKCKELKQDILERIVKKKQGGRPVNQIVVSFEYCNKTLKITKDKFSSNMGALDKEGKTALKQFLKHKKKKGPPKTEEGVKSSVTTGSIVERDKVNTQPFISPKSSEILVNMKGTEENEQDRIREFIYHGNQHEGEYSKDESNIGSDNISDMVWYESLPQAQYHLEDWLDNLSKEDESHRGTENKIVTWAQEDEVREFFPSDVEEDLQAHWITDFPKEEEYQVISLEEDLKYYPYQELDQKPQLVQPHYA